MKFVKNNSRVLQNPILAADPSLCHISLPQPDPPSLYSSPLEKGCLFPSPRCSQTFLKELWRFVCLWTWQLCSPCSLCFHCPSFQRCLLELPGTSLGSPLQEQFSLTLPCRGVIYVSCLSDLLSSYLDIHYVRCLYWVPPVSFY